jgi:hypothetical protein
MINILSGWISPIFWIPTKIRLLIRMNVLWQIIPNVLYALLNISTYAFYNRNIALDMLGEITRMKATTLVSSNAAEIASE